MLNLEMLLKLLTIAALTIGSIDSSDGELSILECPQIELSLNLTGVGLGMIPNGSVKSKFLTELILNENNISSVTSEAFSHVPKLTHLSLANNLLTSLDLEPFSKIPELKTLILNGNCKPQPQATTFTDYDYDNYSSTTPKPNLCNMEIDTVFHSLTHLYVEHNNIERISIAGSGGLPALTHLHLSHNPLKFAEESMLALRSHTPVLTHLFLEYCGINKLDAWRILPTSVTSLDLDGNSIFTICSKSCSGLNLDSAMQLTALSVSNDKIGSIQVDSFKDMINLATLDLSHNYIYNIVGGTFNNLENLEYLNLEYNRLEQFPVRTFRNLLKLTSLHLGHNSISHISSEHFENMPTLKTLTLNDNSLSIIDPGTFSKLIDLQELSLAGNQLSRISYGVMPIFSSLTTLNLNNNKFESTEHISLDNVTNLIFLFLKDNPLTTIRVDWLEGASENLTISLGNKCSWWSIHSP